MSAPAIDEILTKMCQIRSSPSYEPQPEFVGSAAQCAKFLSMVRAGWERHDARIEWRRRMVEKLNRMTP